MELHIFMAYDLISEGGNCNYTLIMGNICIYSIVVSQSYWGLTVARDRNLCIPAILVDKRKRSKTTIEKDMYFTAECIYVLTTQAVPVPLR
jgi:hypothetical protein